MVELRKGGARRPMNEAQFRELPEWIQREAEEVERQRRRANRERAALGAALFVFWGLVGIAVARALGAPL